jgi:DEAD/DEAH box helicase domain-containing protein
LSQDGLWTNAPNDYGPEWTKIRLRVRTRDGFRCQVCGRPENGPSNYPSGTMLLGTSREHDVHHRVPFRTFRDETGRIDRERANQLTNLITLCPECHRKAETNVRVRSGLAGLGYVLSQLAPLFLMCDPGDLGQHIEPVASTVFAQPSVVLYDMVPAGIGFSQRLFAIHADLMRRALELVSNCPCEDGCPSCVGPGGENGMGGKLETLAILKAMVG